MSVHAVRNSLETCSDLYLHVSDEQLVCLTDLPETIDTSRFDGIDFAQGKTQQVQMSYFQVPYQGHSKVIKITDDKGNYRIADSLKENLFAPGANWLQAPTRYLKLEFAIVNRNLKEILFFNVASAYTENGVYSVEAIQSILPVEIFEDREDYVVFVVIFVTNCALFIIVYWDAK